MTAAKILPVYRVAAWVTGVALLVLVLVGVPLQIFFHNEAVVSVGGVTHGFLYMAYIVITLVLAERARWRPLDALVILACGTIPFASFFAERRVTRQVHAGLSPFVGAPAVTVEAEKPS